MKFLLNDRERAGLTHTLSEYYRRFGSSGMDDENLFVHLGDNPQSWLCWSGTSGRIPTFRTGSGKFYNPHHEVWLLSKDKLACLGFPVVESMAISMGLPGLPVADQLRASSVAGNSFHFASVAVVHLVAMSCFSYRRVDQ